MIQIQRILIPTDFSDFSKHAIRYGCGFARKFEAEIHLMNVVEDLYPLLPEPGIMIPPPGDYLKDLQGVAEEALQNLVQECCTDGLNVVQAVVTGTPSMEILRYIRDLSIDLVVIGTHGRSGLMHVLMGSVAENVVRKSTCPVLTVRPEGEDFVMPVVDAPEQNEV